MMQTLWALAQIFTQLSVLAFGGGNTILPEMQRQVVDVHGWMTAADFSALFALGQAAPGPNHGGHAGGLARGRLVRHAGHHPGQFGPSSIITVIALGLWERFKDRPWRGIVQAGIFPMTVGLVAASASLITESSVHSWLLGAITAAVAILGSVTRIHPLWLLFAGSMVGLLGIG